MIGLKWLIEGASESSPSSHYHGAVASDVNMTQPRLSFSFIFVALVILSFTFMQGLDDLLQSPSRPDTLSVKGLEDLLASPEASVGETANGNCERAFNLESASGASSSLIDAVVGVGHTSGNDLGSDDDSASDDDADSDDSIDSCEICDTDGVIEDDSFNDAMGLKMAAHSKKIGLLSPESCRAAADYVCGYINAPIFFFE